MDIADQVRFGTDGIRGKFPDVLSLKVAYCLGHAIADVIGVQSDFYIGRDTRVSGPQLSSAIAKAIQTAGGTIRDLGIIPTPGVAALAQKNSVPAVVITASHNPPEDNGIKVLGVGGQKVTSEMELQIESSMLDCLSRFEEIDFEEGESPSTNEAIYEYAKYLIEFADRPKLDGLKVVLDCANGAAHFVGPHVFEHCGADVQAINTESDGKRINENCGAVHLEDLQKAVMSYGADIGFAFDGDADRVMVVDNKGNIVDGDKILALFAIDMKALGSLSNNAVVATTMSNGALRLFLREHDIEFVETDVGDKYVLAEMLRGNFSLGGEQSGHIIRSDKQFWGDGILNSLSVASIVKSKLNRSDASSILNLFVPLIQKHDKVQVAFKKNATDSQEILSQKEDLLKQLGQNSRIIIRPSGTEEVVRISVEASDESEALSAIEQLKETVIKVCN